MHRDGRAMCCAAGGGHGRGQLAGRPVRCRRHGRGRSRPIPILPATATTAGVAVAIRGQARTGNVTATAVMLRLGFLAADRLAAASDGHQRRLKRQHRGCQPYKCGPNELHGAIHQRASCYCEHLSATKAILVRMASWVNASFAENHSPRTSRLSLLRGLFTDLQDFKGQ